MSNELPPIFRDKRGALLFRCPLCGGRGTRTHEIWNGGIDKGVLTKRNIDACEHCFGFGRLPVPSWYSKQLVERAVGDSIEFVNDMLDDAKKGEEES